MTLHVLLLIYYYLKSTRLGYQLPWRSCPLLAAVHHSILYFAYILHKFTYAACSTLITLSLCRAVNLLEVTMLQFAVIAPLVSRNLDVRSYHFSTDYEATARPTNLYATVVRHCFSISLVCIGTQQVMNGKALSRIRARLSSERYRKCPALIPSHCCAFLYLSMIVAVCLQGLAS